MNDKNPENEVQGEKKQEKRRRKLLKAVAAGGGVAVGMKGLLPHKWTSPVVESVLLPAHAATSGPLGIGDPCTGATLIPDPNNIPDGWFVAVTGVVTGTPPFTALTVRFTGTHGNVVRVTNNVPVDPNTGLYNGTVGPFSCSDSGATGTTIVVVDSTDPRLAGVSTQCPVVTTKCEL